MTERETSRSTGTRAVIGVILVVLLVTGPLSGIDVTGESPTLGDGTATVTILEPDDQVISVTDGRFGTNVSYVRMPDLRVTVDGVSGQPRLLYIVQVPELGLDESNRRVISSTGRLRVPLRDQALRQKLSGTYEGRVIVRIQSFDGMETIENRSIEVRAR